MLWMPEVPYYAHILPYLDIAKYLWSGGKEMGVKWLPVENH